jgi:hypothetical protein
VLVGQILAHVDFLDAQLQNLDAQITSRTPASNCPRWPPTSCVSRGDAGGPHRGPSRAGGDGRSGPAQDAVEDTGPDEALTGRFTPTSPSKSRAASSPANRQAEGSWIGIVLALIGIILMPVFGQAKRRLATSSALPPLPEGEPRTCSRAGLSMAILLGLAANLLLELTWADPLVA